MGVVLYMKEGIGRNSEILEKIDKIKTHASSFNFYTDRNYGTRI